MPQISGLVGTGQQGTAPPPAAPQLSKPQTLVQPQQARLGGLKASEPPKLTGAACIAPGHCCQAPVSVLTGRIPLLQAGNPCQHSYSTATREQPGALMQHHVPTVEPATLDCMRPGSTSPSRGQEHFQGPPAVVGASLAMEGRSMGCRQALGSMRGTGSASHAAGRGRHRYSAARSTSCVPPRMHTRTSSSTVPACWSSSAACSACADAGFRVSMPASISDAA